MGFAQDECDNKVGGVQEGPQSYSVEDLGAEVSHSWGGLVRGPSLLSWLSILGRGVVWLGPNFLAQIAF